MKKYIVIILWLSGILLLSSCENSEYIESEVKEKIFENLEEEESPILNKEGVREWSQKFKSSWLKTNTDKTSINLDLILGWGPAKDWIPAIDEPKFYSIEEAEKNLDFLSDASTWIAVNIGWEAKFYPYNILVWHEIVNDSVWWKNIAVTFCPLCGSAVVYNRDVDWEKIRFGVSGKLYESNLLMYDDKTESLWSQSIWEALVWEKLWKKLEYIKSDLMSFGDFKKNYNSWKVLTDDTWASRDYSQIPYGDYTSSDDLYFPVQNSDERFQTKEMFYIVNSGGESVAFKFSDLREQKKAELNIWENKYTAVFDKWIVAVWVNWKELAWYYEMWFSWATHNKGSKNVWKK